jgi:hypothetical protein
MLNELCYQCILHRWNRLALSFPSMYGTKYFDENFLGKSQIMGNAQYGSVDWVHDAAMR